MATPFCYLELIRRSHHTIVLEKHFPWRFSDSLSVGAQRGGKHALQHAPRTATSEQKLSQLEPPHEAHFELETVRLELTKRSHHTIATVLHHQIFCAERLAAQEFVLNMKHVVRCSE